MYTVTGMQGICNIFQITQQVIGAMNGRKHKFFPLCVYRFFYLIQHQTWALHTTDIVDNDPNQREFNADVLQLYIE